MFSDNKVCIVYLDLSKKGCMYMFVYIKNAIINHEIKWLPTRGEREQSERKIIEARLTYIYSICRLNFGNMYIFTQLKN